MATTVTYKGQTLTTVENETKALATAGTWVEDDFTLTDVTEGGGGSSLDDYMSGVDIAINSNISYLKSEGITSNNVTEIVLPECIEFAHCAVCPAVSYLNGGGEPFTKLTKISLPKLKKCSGRILNSVQGNTDLSLVLPSLAEWATQSNARQFDLCTRITKYDFGNSSITAFNWGSGMPFYRCPNVTDIVLRFGGVPTLGNANVFRKDNTSNLPLGTSTFIYVPSALLTQYQQANYWSTLYASYPDMFKTIEGSQYEHYYADGTPIE